MSKILTKINKYTLFGLVFLTPLLFLPFAQNTLNLPKRVLALLLVLVSLIAWLVKQKMQGQLKLKKVGKSFYWAAGLLLGVFTLAAVFSVGPEFSFWGAPYSVTDSLLTFLVLAIFSFLIVHSFSKEDYIDLMHVLIGSFSLVGLLAILQLYGVDLKLGVSTLAGSYNMAAVVAAVVLPLALALLFHSSRRKYFLGVSSVVLLLTLIVINFKAAWLILSLGVLVSLFFSTWQSEIKTGWVLSLMTCLALAIFFFLFRASLPYLPSRPAEVSLTLNSEYEIVNGTLAESFKNKVLGSGPGSFVFQYSQHRSPALNRTVFWGTRFNRGTSTFWDWVITKGVLGGLALIALWGIALWKGFKRVVQVDSSHWGLKLGLLSSLTALVGAAFLVSFNFSMWFLFWLTLGLLGGLFYPDIKRIELNSKLANSGYSLLLLLVIILGAGLLVLQGVRYYAATQHKRGLQLANQGQWEQAINRASTATQLHELPFNSPVDLYYRDLGQLHLRRANQVNADESEINPGQVQTSVKEGSSALNRAIDITPFNPANWSARGFFYRNLIGLEQAGDLALESYQKAAELEPSSPFSHTEIARVNILLTQEDSEQGSLEEALKALDEAIKLKSDYAPAHYLKAVVYDQQGNLQQAIDNLQQAEQAGGEDPGLTYQLGLLYWRNDEIEQAQTKFEQAVGASSNYSNARYMLGLVYNEQDQKQKAQQQFEKVAELNPDNERVEQILENLQQGRSALEQVGTSTAPIEETPEEIQE